MKPPFNRAVKSFLLVIGIVAKWRTPQAIVPGILLRSGVKNIMDTNADTTLSHLKLFVGVDAAMHKAGHLCTAMTSSFSTVGLW